MHSINRKGRECSVNDPNYRILSTNYQYPTSLVPIMTTYPNLPVRTASAA